MPSPSPSAHQESLTLPSLGEGRRSETLEDLTAQRFLRLAAGQIVLAQKRAEEVSSQQGLSDKDRDDQFERIGHELNGWFRLAESSARGTLVEGLMSECKAFTTYGQFGGQDWFANENSKRYPTNWKKFLDVCAEKVIEATRLANGQGFVAEFQLENLSPSMRSEIVSLLQKWRIDANSKEPQVGLEWLVTQTDVDSYLSRDNAIVFLHIVDNQVRGVNITYSDIQLSEIPHKSIPSPGGSSAGAAWCAENGISEAEVLYVFLVATERDNHTPGAYRELLKATEQTALLLGKSHMLGGVRVKNDKFPANAAMDAHKKVGWTAEDSYFTSAVSGAKAQLISKPVGGAHVLSELHFPLVEPTNVVVGDPRAIQERSERGVVTEQQALEAATRFLREHGLRGEFTVEVLPLSGEQLCVSLWTGNIQHSFHQVKPGVDQWTNLDDRVIRSLEDSLAFSLRGYLRPRY